MDRVYHCPGSIALERTCPEPKQEETATTGNKVHYALETGDDTDLEMSEEEIRDALARMERNAVAKWREDFGISAEPTVVREQRHWIRSADLELVASARPDVEYHANNHALVINYKTGFKDPTPSEVNNQIRTEAVAVSCDNPNLVHVRAAIAASRLVSRFDSCDFDAAALRQSKAEIEFICWRASRPGAPLAAGEWCRYCKAKAVCQQAAALSMLPVVGMPPKDDELALVAAVKKLPPEHLGFLYSKKSTIEAIIDAVEYRLKNLSEDDLKSAGYTIAPGNTYRDITDTIGAFNALAAILTNDERMNCIKLVEGRAIEIVMAKDKLTKKAATDKVRSTIASFQNTRIGNPKLKKL